MVAKKAPIQVATAAVADDPTAQQILQQIVNREMDAGGVFGAAVTHAGRTVIPVARVSGGGGGGFGSGSGAGTPGEPGDDDATAEGEGEGGGMGFGQMARPVGFIEMSEAGVRWRPTWDPTTLIVAGAVAWVVTAVFWGLRPKRIYVRR